MVKIKIGKFIRVKEIYLNWKILQIIVRVCKFVFTKHYRLGIILICQSL